MSSDRRQFTSTEIKAGALVLSAVTALALLVAAIRGCAVAGEEIVRYHAVFTDVGGLISGSMVRFGGHEVGRVETVELDPDDPHRIRVTARVAAAVPVNADSVATIAQVSLTSEKHLEVSVGDGDAERLAPGAQIPSVGNAGGLFDLPDVEGVIVRLETLLDDIVELVGVNRIRESGDGEIVDLAELVRGLDELLTVVTTSARDIRGWIERDPGGASEVVAKLIRLEDAAIELFEELQAAVSDNRPALGRTTDNLARVTGRAGEVLEELSRTLEDALTELGSASSAARELVAGQSSEIEQIVENLRRATRDLQTLSRRLADDPSLLIRRDAPEGRMPGEQP